MDQRDRDFMELAVTLAEECKPDDPKRTPRLGVVIAAKGRIIALASRGTGLRHDDDHAELKALMRVKDPESLVGATVYSTLEPCTDDVRREAGTSCSARLGSAGVKKVFVGILDPNQGVCGKGIMALQYLNVEVALFDDDLSRRIQKQNEEFILAHKTLGAAITKPGSGEKIELVLQPWGSWWVERPVRCRFITPPGLDVFVFVEKGGTYWPQAGSFSKCEGTDDLWETKINFGGAGPHVIHVVRANGLGVAFVGYHRAVIAKNVERVGKLKERVGALEALDDGAKKALLADLPGSYQGITIGELPKGFDSQHHVSVIVTRPDLSAGD